MRQKLRNFMVKHFALYYIAIIFGQSTSWVRQANWLFPSMLVGGIWSAYTSMDFLNPVGIAILLFIAIQAYIMIFYFRYNPIKYDELDDDQKHQYSRAFFKRVATKPWPEEEVVKVLQGWEELNNKIMHRKETVKFYNVGAFLSNIIITIISLIILMGGFI